MDTATKPVHVLMPCKKALTLSGLNSKGMAGNQKIKQVCLSVESKQFELGSFRSLLLQALATGKGVGSKLWAAQSSPRWAARGPPVEAFCPAKCKGPNSTGDP